MRERNWAVGLAAVVAVLAWDGGAYGQGGQGKQGRDRYEYAGVSPEKAAEVMTVPEGFKAGLFAGEPDVVQPIAFTIDDRGRLWVAEAMTYPVRQAEGKGRDRIIILEDTKGTGHFDKRTVFAEHLNLVSGIELGFGGVYVGAAPYLMFIPVNDWDNPKPAGEAKILLDGWGWGDTHETLNTFCWGPDGWLYGCHGIFTQSNVGAPGTPTSKRVHINGGIWRYHPTRHVFERFAEGTSNPWGIDFDQKGQIIIEACVVPHLWHIIQGAHYQRQAGRHDNPYVYDDIKQIADHVHWVGTQGPHAGNGKSDAAGGGHAHAGMMVYQGGAWPEKYNGSYFMNNIHGARINMDVPEVSGSGYVGHHGKDFILFNDEWSQIVNLRGDQDGAVYMIDWYDKQQCHTTDPNLVDRTNGRIFKVNYGTLKATPVALDKLSDAELVQLQLHKNDWYVRTARRVLQERAAAGKLDREKTKAALLEILNNNPDGVHQLRALWALHVIGELTPQLAMEQLKRSEKPYLQSWAIQLLCEQSNPPADAVKTFARLANESSSAVVRLYAAAACQRMPVDQAWDIVTALLSHDEDAQDHNLPLMDWWALEPLAGKDASRAMALALETKIPTILTFTTRRVAIGGKDQAIATLTTSLSKVDDDRRQSEILTGMTESLRGRRNAAMPAGWDAIEKKLLASSNAAIRTLTAGLAVTFGSKEAIAYETKVLSDRNADVGQRRGAIDAMSGAKYVQLPGILQPLLGDSAVRGPAIRALATFDDPKTPAAIVENYHSFSVAEKKDALNTLAARPAYARELLSAVGAGKIPPRDVSADIVRQLRNLHDDQLNTQVAKVWGVLRESPQDKLKRIAELRKMVQRPYSTANISHGRTLFAQTCAQCHTLFDTGGHVGPDITGSNRADLEYILQRVVDPNSMIQNEYRPVIIKTNDDRVLTGIIKKDEANALTLQTANEVIVIPKSEIAQQKISPLGMMPEGLLDNFKEQDVRDIVAYLRSPKQVPLPATASGTGSASAK
jgi:putative membrane-bound dehydrogenase-like protein